MVRPAQAKNRVTSARRQTMDVFDALTSDHDKVKKILEQEHHIEEEESTVFDVARSVLDEDRSEEVAKRFKKLKKEAPAHAIQVRTCSSAGAMLTLA
jgi:hemerythrin-like domain-containing protein